MKLTTQQVSNFQERVWGYFGSHERDMPWRSSPSGYRVLVSELMLQQTQVSRVLPKFAEFLVRFPDIQVLAAAPLADVLVVWSGLGYNRRARFLHQAAQKIVVEYGGKIPETLSELTSLPGVGPNTAGAILAYAFRQPVVFVETNIRTVLFHHFYAEGVTKVSDRALLNLASQLLDHEQPREWYWALMDYGTYLKKSVGGRLDQSKHYKKQAPFAGSIREMRGRILKNLTGGPSRHRELSVAVGDDERFESALQNLLDEGLIDQHGDLISLTGNRDAR